MAGALNTGSGVPGNLWNTNSAGVATPQAGRPALTGGLQQMQMLAAYRNGLPMSQLQAMNPYTARPTQFLPQAIGTFDYGAQAAQQKAAADAAALAQANALNARLGGYMPGGGPGGGDGSPGSASSDGGADGSAGAGDAGGAAAGASGAGGGGGGGGK